MYLQKDVTPLLTLVELALDAEVRTRAAMVLDLLFMDFAEHTLRDAYGVTHGRSYKKDKLKSTDEDTWRLTKMLFASSSYDWDRGDSGGSGLSASTKYALPEVVRRVAADPEPAVLRDRTGLPMPEAGPIDSEVVAPYGFSYTDPNDLGIWWGMGALTAWPVVPLTIDTFNRYGLSDNEASRSSETSARSRLSSRRTSGRRAGRC